MLCARDVEILWKGFYWLTGNVFERVSIVSCQAPDGRGRDVWRVVWRKCLMCLGSRHVATCPAVEQWLKCDTSVINGHEDRLGINQPITGPYKVLCLARATDVRCCDVTTLCFINTLLHVYNQPKKLTFTSQITHWWHIFGTLKSASKIFIVS